MADNFTANAGSGGPSFASDDVSADAHYPFVKVALGANDQASREGWTPYKLISAATTNATSVKASKGVVGMLVAMNKASTPAYVKLYNKASAPTVGTDTPVQVFMIPGNTAGAGLSLPVPLTGLKFDTGIAFAITGGIADSDTTAVAANDVVVNLGYV